ncbi:hypothetical protein PR002_g4507 [Phytophthora rubi]|uniref:Uncharacterized protein n=1 Tax=Phytophthora rubi TaxID=129364 RepID=A0A6A3NGR9_9STRA|nr:hypothetical protein PR002_g4507 [Phytophthora rubi]
MARGARGVTCRECGCLNFSSEHDVCDSCRSQAPIFRPTARRAAASAAANASNSRRNEDATHAQSKKRRHEDTTNTSNKRHAEDKPKPAPPASAAQATAKRQPDVIDLISDDEEEEEDQVEVQQVVAQSLESHKQETERCREQEQERTLFQSRVFPSVAFVASDFPTLEAGGLMRKRAAEKDLVQSQPTGAVTQVKDDQMSASQPAPVVAREAKQKEVHPKPTEPRPPPAVTKEKKEEVETTVAKVQTVEPLENQVLDTRTHSTAGGNVQAGVGIDASAAVEESKPVEDKAADHEDPFFQARVFDSVAFQASDFVTVFDGLAVARRSHPPVVAASSSTATSTTVGSAAATGPASTKTIGGTQPAQASTAATPALPSTASAASLNAATKGVPEVKTSTAPAKTTLQSAVTTPPKETSATAVPVKPNTASASANVTIPAPKPSAATGTAATVSVAASKQIPAQAPSITGQASSASGGTVATTTTAAGAPKAAPPSTVASTTPPLSAPVALKPSPSVSTSTKSTATTTAAAPTATSSTPITASSAPPTQVSSASAANSEQTQSNDSANVLLPKKKHPDGVRSVIVKQRHSESPATESKASSDVDGVQFVKVTAAPFEVVRDVPVEAPVLGYCSPEFLAFMRECGGEDVDEDDDPEEVSLSQLKLLNIVDLTNLSDSDDMDSDSESPAPTPRAGVASVTELKNEVSAIGGAGQPTAAATPLVSGKRTWFVPTLDSERKRAKPEKVMCELCEESGVPSRLTRCFTCMKYYHKKCAKENGDENICWNCELGSMIDDSELDAEHDKHDSEYLAYLRAIRRASSPVAGEGEEEEEGDEEEDEEEEEGDENQRDGAEGATGGDDVEMATTEEGGAASKPFAEGNNSQNPGKQRWMEFIGGATADIDASFHEVTNRIAEELRDEEKKQLYSRGFVSREEFEAQMTEVEEHYITEEARLQQLEREKAIEARKAAEARKAQVAAEQAAASAASTGVQPAAGAAGATAPAPSPAPTPAPAPAPAPTAAATNASNATPSSTMATAVSTDPPNIAPVAPVTTTAAPPAQPVTPAVTHAAASAPSFMAAPTAAFAAVFKATMSRLAPGAPPRAPQP